MTTHNNKSESGRRTGQMTLESLALAASAAQPEPWTPDWHAAAAAWSHYMEVRS